MKLKADPKEKRVAQFSDDRKYRYRLRITWDYDLPTIHFIGLNPSVADETGDDRTLRRVKDFSKAWGYGGVIMSNLFAWVDTDRTALTRVPHPIAEYLPDTTFISVGNREFENKNDLSLYTAWQECKETVACWGTWGKILYRGTKVKMMLPGMKCIALTSGGFPQHPLYLDGDLRLREFN